MEEEIYKAPSGDVSNSDTKGTELREVAMHYRSFMYAVLGQFLLMIFLNKVALGGLLYLGIVALYLGMLSFYCVRLSAKLNPPAVTVILGILAIPPLINFIVLLIVGRQTTAYFRAHGIAVGFLGVDPDSIKI